MVFHDGSARGVSRRRVLQTVGTAGVVGTTGVAGCLGAGDDETVQYGLLAPLTGSFSALGEEMVQGAELAIQQVNEDDAFPYTIEYETYDTQADTARGRQVAEQAVQEFGADYLCGAISSSVAIGINDFAQSEEVLYNPSAASVAVTGPECNEWVFRFETSTAQIAEPMAQYTAEELGDNIWYHLADYAYGDSVKEEFERRIDGAADGYTEVDTTRSEFGSTDFEAFISQISDNADDIDAVVVGMTGGDLAIFLQQASRQGLIEEVPIVTTTASFRAVKDPIGEAAYGVYSGVRYVSSLDTGYNQMFVSAYEDEYDAVPDSFARTGYGSIRMTATGIAEAESTDPAEVRETLPGLEQDSLFGSNQFRECDQQAMNPAWMGRLIEPDDGEAAEVELLLETSGEDAAPPCDQTGCSL